APNNSIRRNSSNHWARLHRASRRARENASCEIRKRSVDSSAGLFLHSPLCIIIGRAACCFSEPGSRDVRIGAYDIIPIETGRFALDGGAMFGIVPKPLWAKVSPPDERNRITLAARGLLAVGNGRKILIDNGNGSKFTEKQVDIYRL